jgi:hypothetical protein
VASIHLPEEAAMNKPTDPKTAAVRCLSGAAALVVTFTIVVLLDGLSDHYSAGTLAKAPSAIVVASAR